MTDLIKIAKDGFSEEQRSSYIEYGRLIADRAKQSINDGFMHSRQRAVINVGLFGANNVDRSSFVSASRRVAVESNMGTIGKLAAVSSATRLQRNGNNKSLFGTAASAQDNFAGNSQRAVYSANLSAKGVNRLSR